MSELSTKFEKIVKAIDETITDFTTLDVITISGDIKTIIKDDNKFIQPVELIKNYDPKTSTIRVEAFTHVDLDQDVIQFYRDGLKEEDLTYKLHQQAVESSKAARQAVLNFIKEVVK
ncbi:MAG: hypothetical protein Q8T04_17785 [Bacteroidota bacterium]|nr:hypothetical protein [Bacteroidota bacterium]